MSADISKPALPIPVHDDVVRALAERRDRQRGLGAKPTPDVKFALVYVARDAGVHARLFTRAKVQVNAAALPGTIPGRTFSFVNIEKDGSTGTVRPLSLYAAPVVALSMMMALPAAVSNFSRCT
jgi:hypothetical protein